MNDERDRHEEDVGRRSGAREVPATEHDHYERAEEVAREAHFRHDPAHFDLTPEEALEDARAELQQKARQVSQEELERFVSQAVRLFLQGSFYAHHDSAPEFELALTEDTVVLNLRNLDDVVTRAKHRARAEAREPEAAPGPLTKRWRFAVQIDGEDVVEVGPHVNGVLVHKGRTGLDLLKETLKGLARD